MTLVSDTCLYTSRPVDRSTPQSQGYHIITKRQPVKRQDGEVKVVKVSKKEMKKLFGSNR